MRWSKRLEIGATNEMIDSALVKLEHGKRGANFGGERTIFLYLLAAVGYNA